MGLRTLLTRAFHKHRPLRALSWPGKSLAASPLVPRAYSRLATMRPGPENRAGERPGLSHGRGRPAGGLERNVHCLLGLPIDAVDLNTALQRVRMAAENRKPCFLSTPNLNFVVACRSDSAFRDSVNHSDLCIADGMPLVWAARLLGIPIQERVAGANLFEALRRQKGGRPLRVYFFGGKEGVAAAAAQRLNAEPGGLLCVGYDCPGFGSIEAMSSDERLRKINESRADFLVVALGAKKGQAWIERNRSRLKVPVISHLGAVINFIAGTVERAPTWMQRTGLEWLWRIKEEPDLWRRYWSDGLAFGRLLATRVIPRLWYTWQHKPGGDEIARARVEASTSPGQATIRLHGAWLAENLHLLRQRLSSPFLANRDLHLDMQEVNYVDSAFVGFILLIKGYQHRQGRRLSIGPVPRPVRQMMEYDCAEFLLA